MWICLVFLFIDNQDIRELLKSSAFESIIDNSKLHFEIII